MQQATAAQLRALTVPGTLPGVIRNCTPVRVNDGTVSYRTISTGTRGKMAGLVGTPPAPLRHCAVDLTDATGRAHVAWALAVHLARCPIDFALVSWRYNSMPCNRGEYAWDLSWELRRARWSDGGHVSEERYGLYLVPQPLEEAESQKVIPALAGLDPCDPTRLPDDSRWVDAEALRRVALHVLGSD